MLGPQRVGEPWHEGGQGLYRPCRARPADRSLVAEDWSAACGCDRTRPKPPRSALGPQPNGEPWTTAGTSGHRRFGETAGCSAYGPLTSYRGDERSGVRVSPPGRREPCGSCPRSSGHPRTGLTLWPMSARAGSQPAGERRTTAGMSGHRTFGETAVHRQLRATGPGRWFCPGCTDWYPPAAIPQRPRGTLADRPARRGVPCAG